MFLKKEFLNQKIKSKSHPSHAASLPSKQRGAMLVVALFIATVLLTLGLALSNVLSSSAKDHALEYYGARSFLAAQSGIQRYLNDVYVGAQGCSAVTYTFNSAQFANCTVELVCSSELNVTDPTRSSGQVDFYQLQSDATCETGEFTAHRQVVIEVRQ